VTRTKDDTLRAPIEGIVGDALGRGLPTGEDLANRLEELIVSGRLTPGSRLLSERDLADMLSVSRPMVSQAIRILVVRGLIESRRGSGSYVTSRPTGGSKLLLDLNVVSIPQLNELRLWLETTGIVNATERATAAEIATGEKALARLRDSAGDTASWMSANTRFHATLVGAAHNAHLATVYESVHTALINHEYQRWIASGDVPAWLHASEAEALDALHEPILRAVQNRDTDAAREAVLRHHLVMAQHLAESGNS
jgi:GntR family transcriptional repressor for pyruvate dehydrogenase complex